MPSFVFECLAGREGDRVENNVKGPFALWRLVPATRDTACREKRERGREDGDGRGKEAAAATTAAMPPLAVI